ncbi:probable LRR receptor-like serine/threonine-protein kinase At1g14390 [Arachis hypogaea]|uniref:non-specific serine/threonine protein kinase n=1 Tax=Arachis hypogaea TaxID=3818 RepID=A0A445D9C8_ARAHY|nr:probable LRR receptor-like serine/threonine-protein kinase At1g14390 isoform X1 [Arachis hypogaea]QHO41187.1 putative LRR receptor-like serine/threonine-protein kinase [Arachis hypogaea]QHO41188.1 putative LRR receptor-like serine/threonine-protein kinase [Arachis hypogaea]RYR59774.1 hypothetical protein Ahy_A05g025747 isoform A [Arachis hypogaea]RYR59775.1 hypothetical protein Ahy_A05g025747 isoform B [Arachis hypogaea]
MMKKFLVSFYFLFPATISIILVLLTPIPSAQLTPTESGILLQVQKLLEYPEALQPWNNFTTNFCFLPPSSSLKILCSNGHVTELTIIGNRGSSLSHHHQDQEAPTLSERFSIHDLLVLLSRLSNLKALSLVSLGLWGHLPSEINRFGSIKSMNLSSNFIYGKIPSSISSMRTLKSLVLAHNLLNGTIPDLTMLSSLQELDLGFNGFGPEFPSLSKNIVKIILRNNSFTSQIPSELIKFQRLQQFDISNNGIFGTIPLFLFSLPSLQYLNLASNQLSGSLSLNTSCGSVLTFVDVSYNLLTGNLPSCFTSKSSNRTIMYSRNCVSAMRLSDQYPASYCEGVMEALTAKSPGRSRKEESEIHLGLVLGVLGVATGVAGLVALLILFILKKNKAKSAEKDIIDNKSAADKFHINLYPGPKIVARCATERMSLAALGLPPYCNFTSDEIGDATNNFRQSNLIGEGAQGQLYKGKLVDGSMVLVNRLRVKQKSLNSNSMQNLKKVLPNLRHRNLVSVLGHCFITCQDHPQTRSTIFIVFEHIPNLSSLRDHLTDRIRRETLKWPQRMAISIGIARGIQFLHTGVTPGIYGNNLRIENILLDNSLNPKVSGYSIPLPSKKGVDRRQNQQCVPSVSGRCSNEEKEDIFQLGVILIQIITGKLITSSGELEELKDELERGLSEAASSTPRLTVDPSLRGIFVYESVKTALQITINCLSKVTINRPSIEDVLWNLQYSMQVQEARSSSGNSPRL